MSCINDCVIAREILSKVLYLEIYANSHYVNYPGDGVVLSNRARQHILCPRKSYSGARQ